MAAIKVLEIYRPVIKNNLNNAKIRYNNDKLLAYSYADDFFMEPPTPNAGSAKPEPFGKVLESFGFRHSAALRKSLAGGKWEESLVESSGDSRQPRPLAVEEALALSATVSPLTLPGSPLESKEIERGLTPALDGQIATSKNTSLEKEDLAADVVEDENEGVVLTPPGFEDFGFELFKEPIRSGMVAIVETAPTAVASSPRDEAGSLTKDQMVAPLVPPLLVERLASADVESVSERTPSGPPPLPESLTESLDDFQAARGTVYGEAPVSGSGEADKQALLSPPVMQAPPLLLPAVGNFTPAPQPAIMQESPRLVTVGPEVRFDIANVDDLSWGMVAQRLSPEANSGGFSSPTNSDALSKEDPLPLPVPAGTSFSTPAPELPSAMADTPVPDSSEGSTKVPIPEEPGPPPLPADFPMAASVPPSGPIQIGLPLPLAVNLLGSKEPMVSARARPASAQVASPPVSAFPSVPVTVQTPAPVTPTLVTPTPEAPSPEAPSPMAPTGILPTAPPPIAPSEPAVAAPSLQSSPTDPADGTAVPKKLSPLEALLAMPKLSGLGSSQPSGLKMEAPSAPFSGKRPALAALPLLNPGIAAPTVTGTPLPPDDESPDQTTVPFSGAWESFTTPSAPAEESAKARSLDQAETDSVPLEPVAAEVPPLPQGDDLLARSQWLASLARHRRPPVTESPQGESAMEDADSASPTEESPFAEFPKASSPLAGAALRGFGETLLTPPTSPGPFLVDEIPASPAPVKTPPAADVSDPQVLDLMCPECQQPLNLRRDNLGVKGSCVWCETPIVAIEDDGEVILQRFFRGGTSPTVPVQPSVPLVVPAPLSLTGQVLQPAASLPIVGMDSPKTEEIQEDFINPWRVKLPNIDGLDDEGNDTHPQVGFLDLVPEAAPQLADAVAEEAVSGPEPASPIGPISLDAISVSDTPGAPEGTSKWAARFGSVPAASVATPPMGHSGLPKLGISGEEIARPLPFDLKQMLGASAISPPPAPIVPPAEDAEPTPPTESLPLAGSSPLLKGLPSFGPQSGWGRGFGGNVAASPTPPIEAGSLEDASQEVSSAVSSGGDHQASSVDIPVQKDPWEKALSDWAANVTKISQPAGSPDDVEEALEPPQDFPLPGGGLASFKSIPLPAAETSSTIKDEDPGLEPMPIPPVAPPVEESAGQKTSVAEEDELFAFRPATQEKAPSKRGGVLFWVLFVLLFGGAGTAGFYTKDLWMPWVTQQGWWPWKSVAPVEHVEPSARPSSVPTPAAQPSDLPPVP